MLQAELSAARGISVVPGLPQSGVGWVQRERLVPAGKSVDSFCFVSVLLAMPRGVFDLSLENILIIRAFELVFGAVAQKPVNLMYMWFYGLQSTFLHVTSRFL